MTYLESTGIESKSLEGHDECNRDFSPIEAIRLSGWRVSFEGGLWDIREAKPAHCLWQTHCRVPPFTLSSMEKVIVFPSAEGVKRITSTTFPSCLSVSSIMFSPMRLTETMVLLRSPSIGVSVPSNLAA